MKECFGKRMKAYKKCEVPEDCPDLTECSFATLARVLYKEGNIVVSRRGELVYVDE